MIKETLKRPCPVLDILVKTEGQKNIRDYFLKEDIGFDPNSSAAQRILKAIWHIGSSFGPYHSPTLYVPSTRLEELRLISEDAAHRMSRMKERTSQSLESPPLISTNRLQSTRTPVGGFIITEEYVDVEGFYEMNHSGARLDHMVKEQMYLTREDEMYFVRMEQAKVYDQLHALGESWIPLRTPQHNNFVAIEVTPRRLNTTLALFVEGICRGYIE